MLESYLISVAMKSTVLLAAGMLVYASSWAGGGCAAFGWHGGACECGCGAVAGALVSAMELSYFCPGGRGRRIGCEAAWQPGYASWPMALVAIWALGTLAMAIRAAGGLIMLLRIRRGSVFFQAGDGAEVRIADISTPLTCGVMRPLILLPTSARDWDDLRLRAVLLHESAHVRRRDCMAKYIAQGARALLWWNPLAWMLVARLNHEQELASDDAVLSAGVAAKTYAAMLLEVARDCSSPLVLGCSMGAHSAAALHERFQHLFDWRAETARSTRRTAIAIPLLLLLMTTVSFAEKIYKIGPGIVPPKVLEKHDRCIPTKREAPRLKALLRWRLWSEQTSEFMTLK